MLSSFFKKILVFMVLSLVWAGQKAAAIDICNPLDPSCEDSDSGKNLDDLIGSLMNFVFGIAIVVCPALIVWGGFLIATSGGEEKKRNQGKQIITYAIVGLVVIAMANVIKSVILDIANSK